MAINAKFIADFGTFYSAVQQAEVRLRSFETGAGKVETALNRMADSLSGRKLIQDASLMSEAVDRVGGASKLTQAELQRVAGRASEAVEKLKALGMDIPPGIAKLAAESRTATGALDSMKSMALNVASAFGIAFSVGAIKSFVADVVNTASRVDDLSKKLGVSTDAVQRWEQAVSLSGGSIDTIDRAVAFMNKTLGEGDKGTIAILNKLGLEFNKIRLMRTEDAFNTIAEAITKTEDQMLKAEASTKLFSRSGQELLPAFAQGFSDIAKSATVMSEETIKRLDAAGDAWTKLGNRVTIVSGEMLANAMSMTDRLTSSWARAAQFVSDTASGGIGQAIAKLTAETAAATASVQQHTAAQDAQREAAIKAGQAAAAAAEATKKASEEAERAAKKAAAEAEAQAKAFAALQDRLFGRDVLAKAAEYARALGDIGNVVNLTKSSQAELNRIMGEAYEILVRAGQGASSAAQEYRLLRDATVDLSQKALTAMPGMVASMEAAQGALRKLNEQTRVELTGTLNQMQAGWLSTSAAAESASTTAGASLSKITTEADKATAAVNRLAQGFFAIGNGNVQQLLADASTNMQRGGIAGTVGLLQSQAALRRSNPGAFPSFASGGVGDFGSGTLAMLHGKEAIIPLDKAGVGTTVNVYVTGGTDPRTTGARIGEAVVATLRARGQRV